jgi:TetR/AcrR family transcriptional regulator, mexJK operon transcriptional repressor
MSMSSSSLLPAAADLVEEKRRVRRGETRRCEVAEVAQRIFLERGYSQTTMQAIAEEAGASKETLYRHFGSKEGLFTEIVRAKSAQIAMRLDEEITLSATPDEVLTHVGTSLLTTLTCGDVLSFYGWIIAETPRAPELGRIFYELGPAMVRAKLRDYIERATEQKVLCCDNPVLATKLFLGSILGDVQLRALTLGLRNVSEADISEQVNAAVTMFLARYRYAAKA